MREKNQNNQTRLLVAIVTVISIALITVFSLQIIAPTHLKPSIWFDSTPGDLLKNKSESEINLNNKEQALETVTTNSIANSTKSTKQVTLYFTSEEARLSNCGATIPVTRNIEYSGEEVISNTLQALFSGPTEQDKMKSEVPSLETSFVSWNDVLNKVIQRDKVVQIDFKSAVFNEPYSIRRFGSSCGTGAWQQIDKTLKQFDNVDYVIYSIDGSLDQWNLAVNLRGCPPERSINEPDQTYLQAKYQCGE